MNYIKIAIILGITFIVYKLVYMFQKNELFKTISEQHKPPVHARLDRYGRQMYVSNKPPYRLGEYSCNPRECPENYDTDVTCWGCHELETSPQYV